MQSSIFKKYHLIMIELYEFKISGNSYKIRLMLSLLNINYISHVLNPSDKEHKTDNFLELNPFGQVLVLKDDYLILRDSQAILVYLARKYGEDHWFPKDPILMAETIAWLSTASNEVTRGPATLRLYYLFGRDSNLLEAKIITDQLLKVLEKK